MLETGLFPLKGIRVRCLPCPQYSIADKHPDNAFAAMILRIGAGRSTEDIQAAAAHLNKAAVAHFKPLLDAGTFMLSLDVQINDPALSWKTNGVAARLSQSS